jgi:hypothetical protein
MKLVLISTSGNCHLCFCKTFCRIKFVYFMQDSFQSNTCFICHYSNTYFEHIRINIYLHVFFSLLHVFFWQSDQNLMSEDEMTTQVSIYNPMSMSICSCMYFYLITHQSILWLVEIITLYNDFRCYSTLFIPLQRFPRHLINK